MEIRNLNLEQNLLRRISLQWNLKHQWKLISGRLWVQLRGEKSSKSLEKSITWIAIQMISWLHWWLTLTAWRSRLEPRTRPIKLRFQVASPMIQFILLRNAIKKFQRLFQKLQESTQTSLSMLMLVMILVTCITWLILNARNLHHFSSTGSGSHFWFCGNPTVSSAPKKWMNFKKWSTNTKTSGLVKWDSWL